MKLERSLDSLHPLFKPLAIEFLARLTEAKIPVLVISTIRTKEQQRKIIESGQSWTQNSKHLLGMAIDVAPYEKYDQYGPDDINWNDEDPVWQKIGEIGKSIGLKWGVIKSDGKRIDLGHFEMPKIEF